MIKTIISLPCKVWAYFMSTLAFVIFSLASPAILVLEYLEEKDD